MGHARNFLAPVAPTLITGGWKGRVDVGQVDKAGQVEVWWSEGVVVEFCEVMWKGWFGWRA